MQIEGTLRASCDQCGIAKKRCNGSFPCANCVKWGKKCVFSLRKRPGPNGFITSYTTKSNKRSRKRLKNYSCIEYDEKSLLHEDNSIETADKAQNLIHHFISKYTP